MLPISESYGNQESIQTVFEESTDKREAPNNDLLKKFAKTEISPTSPNLLAWSSERDNKIRIVELETKKEFSNFDGVKVGNPFKGDQSCTLVKETANTGLLVSVHHRCGELANLAVVGVSRKGQAKKIYSFEEAYGVTCDGDVTYNPRRRVLGAIPVQGKITYHLYSFSTSKAGNAVNSSENRIGNNVTSFDFNPNGKSIAIVDSNGMCSISDVNTEDYRFYLNFDSNMDLWIRCRWSTNAGEPLLYVRYDKEQLNILDVEKKALTSKNPVVIDPNWLINWIDVCQNDANLLVAGGVGHTVRIFDKRESKVIQTFDDVHEFEISCVRWSPSVIASASGDKAVALVDFKTGKKIYEGKSIYRKSPWVCLLHVRKYGHE